MHLIGAGFGGETDGAHRAAIFRLHARGFHGKLLNRVHRSGTDGCPLILIVGRCAGQGNAVHRHLPTGGLPATDAELAVRAGLCFRCNQGQVEDVSNLARDHQRQVLDKFAGQICGHARRFGLECGRPSGDFHCFADGADLHSDVQPHRGAGFQGHSVMNGPFESSGLGFDAIRTDVERRNRVIPCIGSRRGKRGIGGKLRCRNTGAGNGSSGWIDHNAGQRGFVQLSLERGDK